MTFIEKLGLMTQKFKTEGDISNGDLNKFRRNFFPWRRYDKDEVRRALVEWYTAVLENLQKGRTGVFVNTVPVNIRWLADSNEIDDLIFRIYSLLSPIDKVSKIAVSKDINMRPLNETELEYDPGAMDGKAEYWIGPWKLCWAGDLRESPVYKTSLKKVDFLSGYSRLFTDLAECFYAKHYLIEPYAFPRAVSVRAMSKIKIPFVWAQFYCNHTGRERTETSVFLAPPIESVALEKTFRRFCEFMGDHLQEMMEKGFVYRGVNETYLYLKDPDRIGELIDYCADLFIREYKEAEIMETVAKGIQENDDWMEIER